MTNHLKLMLAVPLLALTAGCMANGGNVASTESEIEATTDSDIDGDGSITEGGTEIGGQS